MIDEQHPPTAGFDPTRAAGQWIANTRCPLCDGAGRVLGPLMLQHFHFGTTPVPDAPGTVELHRCTDCTLVYKNWVPSPTLLLSLTTATEEGLWVDSYDYADELRFIRTQSRVPADQLDLLDIGAAGGGLLNNATLGGRRSAMDIVSFSRLSYDGEFIQGFLESESLEWSGSPYDVVTVFDVLEHLYQPIRAVGNLGSLTKPAGIVVIETGDADTVQEALLSAWPYLNYVEHHLAWNRRSLTRFAEIGDFAVAGYENKRHKLAPLSIDTLGLKLKRLMLKHAPAAMKALYEGLGRRVPLTSDPRRHDHLRAVLVSATSTAAVE